MKRWNSCRWPACALALAALLACWQMTAQAAEPAAPPSDTALVSGTAPVSDIALALRTEQPLSTQRPFMEKQPTAVAAPKQAAVRLMSWNIRLDTPHDGSNAWPHRAGAVIALIRQQQPAVLGLQEVLHHQLVRLESALPGYQRIGVGRDDGQSGGEYSPLLVDSRRFVVQDSGTFWFNPDNQIGKAGWDAALPRICSWALLRDKSSGRLLRVLNLHLDHLGAEARRQSVALLASRLKQWQDGVPAVIMGDFNPSGTDQLLQVMATSLPQHRDALSLLSDGMPSDSMLSDSQHASSPAYSYYGWDQQPADGVRLDFLLLPPTQLKLQQAMLIADDPRQRRSDHLPLVADVLWPAPR